MPGQGDGKGLRLTWAVAEPLQGPVPRAEKRAHAVRNLQKAGSTLRHTPQPPRDASLTGDQLFSKGQSHLQGNQAAPKAVSLCAGPRLHSNRRTPCHDPGPPSLHTHNPGQDRRGRARAAWTPRATHSQPARGAPPRRLLGPGPCSFAVKGPEPWTASSQLSLLPRDSALPAVKWAEALLGRGVSETGGSGFWGS